MKDRANALKYLISTILTNTIKFYGKAYKGQSIMGQAILYDIIKEDNKQMDYSMIQKGAF